MEQAICRHGLSARPAFALRGPGSVAEPFEPD
jgi:hypothetical protein